MLQSGNTRDHISANTDWITSSLKSTHLDTFEHGWITFEILLTAFLKFSRFGHLNVQAFLIITPCQFFRSYWCFRSDCCCNIYCVRTNSAQDHMTVVHCCVDFISWFLKMWLFPYPYGFCNPVRIQGRKINDMIWYDSQRLDIRMAYCAEFRMF